MKTLALKQSVVSLARLKIELLNSSPLRASEIEQEHNFRQYFSKQQLVTCRSRLLFSNFHFAELFAERGVTFKFVLIPLETHVWGLPGGWISADRVEDTRETVGICVSPFKKEGSSEGGGNPLLALGSLCRAHLQSARLKNRMNVSIDFCGSFHFDYLHTSLLSGSAEGLSFFLIFIISGAQLFFVRRAKFVMKLYHPIFIRQFKMWIIHVLESS